MLKPLRWGLRILAAPTALVLTLSACQPTPGAIGGVNASGQPTLPTVSASVTPSPQLSAVPSSPAPTPRGSSAAPTSATPTQSGGRDLAYWPFSVDSPWNTPIGSKAEFAPPIPGRGADILKNQMYVTAGSEDAPNVYVATESDPLTKIYHDDSPDKMDFELRVPAAAVPAKAGTVTSG